MASPCNHLKTFLGRLSLLLDNPRVLKDLHASSDRVQSFRKDLQQLMYLAAKQDRQLQRRPEARVRVYDVIERARSVLFEASGIVESAQMELSEHNAPFHKKVTWIFRRSVRFQQFQPVFVHNVEAVQDETRFVKELIMYGRSCPWMNEEMRRDMEDMYWRERMDEINAKRRAGMEYILPPRLFGSDNGIQGGNFF